jgi:membrane protein DedA with SNARE-associated domain
MAHAPEDTMHADLNGLAFVIMTLASTVACTIAYWAGKLTR